MLHGHLIQLDIVSFLALFNAFVQFALIPFQASFRTPLEAYAELFCTFRLLLKRHIGLCWPPRVVIANGNVARRIKATDIVLAVDKVNRRRIRRKQI